MLKFFRTIRKKLIEQDNVRKYLLYAIGEILLVVIGILIALQVNNWNEDRKEQKIADELKLSIISDLTQDIASIDSLQINIQGEIESYDSLQARLIDPEVSEQEIIWLIKEEFVPFLYNFEGFNDNSYRTAQSNGTINSLAEPLRTLLNRLYTKQTDVLRTARVYEQIYLNAISEFNKDYPLQISFSTFRSGPVYDRKWAAPDFDDLTSKFSNVGTSKRNYYRIILGDLNEVQELNKHAINTFEGDI